MQNSKRLIRVGGESHHGSQCMYLYHRKMLIFGWRDLKPLVSTLVSNVLSTVFSREVCVSQISRQWRGGSQEAKKCDSEIAVNFSWAALPTSCSSQTLFPPKDISSESRPSRGASPSPLQVSGPQSGALWLQSGQHTDLPHTVPRNSLTLVAASELIQTPEGC